MTMSKIMQTIKLNALDADTATITQYMGWLDDRIGDLTDELDKLCHLRRMLGAEFNCPSEMAPAFTEPTMPYLPPLHSEVEAHRPPRTVRVQSVIAPGMMRASVVNMVREFDAQLTSAEVINQMGMGATKELRQRVYNALSQLKATGELFKNDDDRWV